MHPDHCVKSFARTSQVESLWFQVREGTDLFTQVDVVQMIAFDVQSSMYRHTKVASAVCCSSPPRR